jgi:hypothetical protein
MRLAVKNPADTVDLLSTISGTETFTKNSKFWQEEECLQRLDLWLIGSFECGGLIFAL